MYAVFGSPVPLPHDAMSFLVSISPVCSHLDRAEVEPNLWVDGDGECLSRSLDFAVGHYGYRYEHKNSANIRKNLKFAGELVRGHFRNDVQDAKRDGRYVEAINYGFRIELERTSGFSFEVTKNQEYLPSAWVSLKNDVVYVSGCGFVRLSLKWVLPVAKHINFAA